MLTSFYFLEGNPERLLVESSDWVDDDLITRDSVVVLFFWPKCDKILICQEWYPHNHET